MFTEEVVMRRVPSVSLGHFLFPNEKSRMEDVIHSGDDHTHTWVVCNHNGSGSKGDSVQCKEESPFVLYTHYVCSQCGKNRHHSYWGDTKTKILEERRDIFEDAKAPCGAD